MVTSQAYLCAMCKKVIKETSRSLYCGDKCRCRQWRINERARAKTLLDLPLISVPTEIQAKLPPGDEGHAVALAFLLRTRAPASARGYRVGTIREGGQSLRWYPCSVNRGLPMFRLEPFEIPIVPFAGRYVVVYTDAGCEPIAEPTFTLEIPFRDRHLRFTDGDTSSWPRLRDVRTVFRLVRVRVRSEHAEG